MAKVEPGTRPGLPGILDEIATPGAYGVTFLTVLNRALRPRMVQIRIDVRFEP